SLVTNQDYRVDDALEWCTGQVCDRLLVQMILPGSVHAYDHMRYLALKCPNLLNLHDGRHLKLDQMSRPTEKFW
ncbi:MAG: hypothetical protein JAZ03_06760, partial [Candidatus Thiodiazotropha taylori]|nr:hypothetical protein [Candidatus Thiodiazotropha taylori]MCW4333623.1 hypothetical protein [Candidatus Thiodiazotropha endolucinida]